MTRTAMFFIDTHTGDNSGQVSGIVLTIGTYQVDAIVKSGAQEARDAFTRAITRRLKDHFPQAAITVVQVPASNDGTWMIKCNGADEAQALQDCQDILARTIRLAPRWLRKYLKK